MNSQTRIFVGNLPDNTNEKDLRAAFSRFGEITNFDLKLKSIEDTSKRNFAFITLASSCDDVESCINHFSHQSFKGQKLYVTRARESFLERLQRERQQEEVNKDVKEREHDNLPTKNPVIKLSEKLNPRKRKENFRLNAAPVKERKDSHHERKHQNIIQPVTKTDPRKLDADKKRIESIKQKRQEFKVKQTIIKSSLLGIDKAKNKKLVFSDHEVTSKNRSHDKDNVEKNALNKKKELFNEDDSGDEISFRIKKQYEGKQGQMVLDLQSRYKSDKRFVLDERFMECEHGPQNETEDKDIDEHENVELRAEDERSKQLDILQDVLGVAIKRHAQDPTTHNKTKSKLGMLRFDPSQPDHAKFLAPVEEATKKSNKKKKKDKQKDPIAEPQPQPVPEVSEEQFYKVSETLKEAIVQPTTFSLRSLFENNENEFEQETPEQDTGFIPLEKPPSQKKKVNNPLDHGDKNPFVYDSSDSEDEGKEEIKQAPPLDVKAVWKENLFFSQSDHRLQEGLAFFNKPSDSSMHKERRELKSLMKKRIYNKDRKNQMFQKKIGGRKKTMKKSYRKKT